MISVSVVATALTKRGLRSIGLTNINFRNDVRIAMPCMIVAAGYIPQLFFPSLLNDEPLNLLFQIMATLLALLLVSRERTGDEGALSSQREERPIILPIFSIFIISNIIDSELVVWTVIFQFFFVGFGEEIMFRGYVQSRLNEGFGYTWNYAGVKFGPGLFITSFLFGIIHLLNPFNPFTGQYALAVNSGIISTFTGFLFGFVREKTGNIIAPSLAHGLLNLGIIIIIK